MSLFGRDTQYNVERARRCRNWVEARTPYGVIGILFGILSIVDSITMVIGAAAGLVAIVLGYIGLRDLKHRPHKMGSGLCTASIRLGLLGIVLSTAVWLLLH